MIHVKRKTLIIHIKVGDHYIAEVESKINSKIKANEFVSVKLFDYFSRNTENIDFSKQGK